MKGKSTVIGISSILIYSFLVVTFFLAIPFMVSWGGKKEWYLLIIEFMENTPYDLKRGNGEIMVSLIFVNALFWTISFLLFMWVISVMSPKRGNG